MQAHIEEEVCFAATCWQASVADKAVGYGHMEAKRASFKRHV